MHFWHGSPVFIDMQILLFAKIAIVVVVVVVVAAVMVAVVATIRCSHTANNDFRMADFACRFDDHFWESHTSTRKHTDTFQPIVDHIAYLPRPNNPFEAFA